jgi:addiction module HigA family antidote
LEDKEMVRIPTNRVPTHPGVMLREEFLDPLGITQRELSNGILVPYQRVNEIINKKRGITPDTALRLAKFFGNTPGFWMNLQLRFDLYQAQKSDSEDIKKIKTLKVDHALV